jgi:hypothetical protein
VSTIDWDAIKAAYRTGQLSNVELGKQFGVSEGAIRKKAKADGWTKDLASSVKRATTERLVRETVREVREDNAGLVPRTDDEIVAEAAEVGAAVVKAHRRDINASRLIVQHLFEQLHDTAVTRERIMDLIAEATADDKSQQRRIGMMKAIGLPMNAATARDLTTALAKLVVLERQAFNIGEKADEEGIEAYLKRLGDGQ